MPRGIPNARAEEVRSTRRRSTGGTVNGLKLAYPKDLMDPDKVYRWASDKDNRLSALTQSDDYEIVNHPAREGEDGKPVTRIVGMHEGKPLLAYLVAKPKRYYDEDQKEKQAPIDAMENDIRRGGTGHLSGIKDGETSSADMNSLYTPGGPNGMSGVNIIS